MIFYASRHTYCAEREQLEAGLKNLTQEKDQYEQSCTTLKLKNDQLQTTYNDMRMNLDGLEANHSDLQRENDELHTFLHQLLSNYSSLRVDNYKLQRSYNTLNISAILLQTNYNSLQKEKRQLQTNYDALQSAKAQLQTTFSNLAAVCRELGEQYLATLKNMTAKMRTMLCQTGWEKLDTNCYFVSTVKKNWASSRQDCIAKGADLVVIDSRIEQAFVNVLLKSGQNAWIGLTDSETEGTWTWVDGTPVTTTYWQAGQPNSHGGNQDCGEVLETSSGVGEWNDDACSGEQTYICEL
ncbi:C-type lectin domain family 4 member E-like [Chelmon rostratus]|uniref:C-type lectin domain family 4 member E-like n=1 Tax=Chelmon rostratus TaxID=109905 RepID=UPI001BE7DA87|nr:C-type lectin domain family 4 member E-like [Chelmon rostratus]